MAYEGLQQVMKTIGYDQATIDATVAKVEHMVKDQGMPEQAVLMAVAKEMQPQAEAYQREQAREKEKKEREQEKKRQDQRASIWVAALIALPLTALSLWLGIRLMADSPWHEWIVAGLLAFVFFWYLASWPARWIVNMNRFTRSLSNIGPRWKCPRCGYQTDLGKGSPLCPHCGAPMRDRSIS